MKDLIYGVKELQARLSSALRAVQAGSRVVVTSHDRPIAEIGPPRKSSGKTSPQERRLQRLIQRGLLLPAVKPGPMPMPRPLRIGGLTEQLLRDRR